VGFVIVSLGLRLPIDFFEEAKPEISKFLKDIESSSLGELDQFVQEDSGIRGRVGKEVDGFGAEGEDYLQEIFSLVVVPVGDAVFDLSDEGCYINAQIRDDWAVLLLIPNQFNDD
jgi:hypothetical protein